MKEIKDAIEAIAERMAPYYEGMSEETREDDMESMIEYALDDDRLVAAIANELWLATKRNFDAAKKAATDDAVSVGAK